MFAHFLRRISNGNCLVTGLINGNGSDIGGKVAVRVVNSHCDCICQVNTGNIKFSGCGIACIALHVESSRRNNHAGNSRTRGRLHTGEEQGEEVIYRHTVVNGECIECIVSIQLFTHTEVHVIHVIVGIITINIEGVTATKASRVGCHVKCAINQGTASKQLRLDQLTPLFLGIVHKTAIIIPLHLNGVTRVKTKGADSLINLLILGTTPVGSIVHIHGITGIEHQITDRIQLFVSVLIGVAPVSI